MPSENGREKFPATAGRPAVTYPPFSVALTPTSETVDAAAGKIAL